MSQANREKLVRELSDAVWLRMALVLIPASSALATTRPQMARLMTRTLRGVRSDVRRIVESHVSL